MPRILVTLRKGETQEYKDAIAKGIQHAMIDVFGIPGDDYFQITNEKDPADMYFDRNFFGIKRSDRPVFIGLTFNHRPAEVKKTLFQAIVKNLTTSPGIPIEDIYMNITELDPANWWAYARTINPETGTDSRMTNAPRLGSAAAG